MGKHLVLLACVIAAMWAAQARAAGELPLLPVGYDAYRMWDRWPQQRIGQRAYMRSTYDRAGGNEGADASHFLRQQADDFNVSLDVAGPGVLYFVRYNHWHGSPWHFVVDDKDHVVTETSTADPNHPAKNAVLEPHAAFPRPLAYTWADTRGADLIWTPIGFEKSFQMAYSRTRYGTGYYIYDQFLPGAKLSQPIKAWDQKPPDADVVKLLTTSAYELAAGGPGLDLPGGKGALPEGATHLQFTQTVGGEIHSIEIRAPRADALDLAHVRLQIFWDGRREPSVDAPIPLFFGAGVLYSRDGNPSLVNAFPVAVNCEGEDVVLRCAFPMPFFKSARVQLTNTGARVNGTIRLGVRAEARELDPRYFAYFHATYRDHPKPVRGADLVLLDTRDVEGGGDWSGSFIGTSFIFSHEANLSTLEGDPRFYFDDSMTPQAQGTGTEEWGGGGDYWGGLNMSLPFAGHPCGVKSPKDARNDLDKIESAYRFLLADLMPFGKNARITLEHGGTNESKEHYETIAYWYGSPAASLKQTDELKIGDERSETDHHYVSPTASAPYKLSSRYEWGVDHLKDLEVYPVTTDQGRTMKGTSEFTLNLEPQNVGVMLRRKLDYAYPNQKARVSVADADSTEWHDAGIWYTAGSNTCVYSNPREELGATQHNVQMSNRRFRDDEFLLGADLTKGRKQIKVRVEFVPVSAPLFPGAPAHELAWSEMHYTAYCYVIPTFEMK